MGDTSPTVPADESERLLALRALEVLDTPPEEEFDVIVRLAAQICGTPIALVSLVDEHRQWFKARVGLEAAETPRDISFCSHAILGDKLMEVPDTGADPRFRDNPLRTGAPNMQFYAGVPLTTGSGHKLGTLCVIDRTPRELTEKQRAGLEALAGQVVRLFELRRSARLHRETAAALQATDDELRDGHASMRSAAARDPRLRSLVVIVLLAIVSAGASAWGLWSAAQNAQTRLERASFRAERFVDERLRAYAQVLRGTAALFRASEHVSPIAFRDYIASLPLTRDYPGILGVGFAERVPDAKLTEFLSEANSEQPGFLVFPASSRSEHFIVRFIEPYALNYAALGYDFASETKRREAAQAAAQRGEITMTPRLKLVQDETNSPGFLLVFPTWAKRAIHSDDQVLSQTGWIFASIRARDMLVGIERAAGSDVDLTLSDTSKGAHVPFFDASSDTKKRSAGITSELDVGGRVWRLRVAPGPGFATLSERIGPWAVLFLGLFATSLTAALLWSLRRTRSRAYSLASRMTAALRRSERTLREVVDGTADFIIATDDRGKLAFTNRAFREALAVTEVEATGMTLRDVVHPASWPSTEPVIESIQNGNAPPARFETAFAKRFGPRIEVEGTVSVMRDDDGTTLRGIFRDVTARKKAETALLAANAELARFAALDGLTGTANRRAFDARLAEEWARAERQKTPLSLIMLDVDYFKPFNDLYGHPTGDQCLRSVGVCLRASVRRAGELAARYGGEEFALLLPGATLEGALEVAERLRASIETLGIAHNRSPLGCVTASLGVACAGAARVDCAEALVAAADRALYRAKHTGRNRVERAE